MRRLRLLRYLIPALLIPFLVWVILAFRTQRVAAPVAGAVTDSSGGTRAEGFSFNDYVEGTKRLFAAAKSGQMNADGSFRVEELERLELYREGAPPLLLSAAKGAGAGPEGQRIIRLEGGVKFEDPDNTMSVVLPSLEVDQNSGVVRSLGEVRLESPTFRGSAQSVVYGLKGQPTEMFGVRFDLEPGAVVVAQRGFVYRQSHELELRGQVHGTQGGSELDADSVRLFRSLEGKLERAEASGGARGVVARPGEPPARFGSDGAEIHWDGPRADRIRLSGRAWIESATSRLTADRIEARSASPDGSRTVTAEGSVSLGGDFRGAPGSLRSARVDAELDAQGRLVRGEAGGGVLFESRDSSGACDRAVFAAGADGGTVTLFSAGDQRARLASGRTRISADRIDSAPDGSRLDAKGNVESTLLPQPGATQTSAGTPLFAAREAVHFLSASLHASGQGKKLEFQGAVRGWQGDRSLAADVVNMDDDQDALVARGSVSTRMPRTKGAAAGEGDFLQVTAESLDYDGKTGHALYRGAVRVRQGDGRMECERLEIDLMQGGSVREVRGFGGVRFDTQAVDSDGSPAAMYGSGDRVIYDPQARTVRLFGDKSPAEVRRSGKQAGTTTGRALLYRMDDGAIEVESGDRNRAKIKTER